MEVHPDINAASEVCERLLGHGILTKETRRNTVRFAPPLTISKLDIDEATARIRDMVSGIHLNRTRRVRRAS